MTRKSTTLCFMAFRKGFHALSEDMNMVVVAQLVVLVGNMMKICITIQHLKTFLQCMIFNMVYR